MCSPRKSNENFSIFTFYESKQMSLTQDLRWSLGRNIALQLQRQTDLLLCTINCFLQWDHLPNMAVGDLAFYYTLYLWAVLIRDLRSQLEKSGCVVVYIRNLQVEFISKNFFHSCHCDAHNIYRLITAYLLLRVNLDKIMHALRFWCVKCTNPEGECIGQVSKLKCKCIILSKFSSTK